MSFGMSGAEMPDYLGTAAVVRDQFAPDWAVVVITLGDFTRGFTATPGYFEWAADRSPPIRLIPEIHRSELSKWTRTIAVIGYLRGNLSMRPSELIRLKRGSDAAAGTGTCHSSRFCLKRMRGFWKPSPKSWRPPQGSPLGM